MSSTKNGSMQNILPLMKDRLLIEPIEAVISQFGDKKKIILFGPRESGKTITSIHYIEQKVNKHQRGLYINLGTNYCKGLMYDDEYECYLEHLICDQLCSYLAKVKPTFYEKHYEAYHKAIKGRLELFKSSLKTYNKKLCHFSSLTKPLIEMLLNELNIPFFSVVYDDFDHRDRFTQEGISKYFDLMPQNIIITADKAVCEEERSKGLIDNGFEIILLNYCRERIIVEAIINKELEEYNKMMTLEQRNVNCSFKEIKTMSQVINSWNINKGIIKAKGNLNVIHKAFCIAYKTHGCGGGKLLSKRIDKVFLDQIDSLMNERHASELRLLNGKFKL